MNQGLGLGKLLTMLPPIFHNSSSFNSDGSFIVTFIMSELGFQLHALTEGKGYQLHRNFQRINEQLNQGFHEGKGKGKQSLGIREEYHAIRQTLAQQNCSFLDSQQRINFVDFTQLLSFDTHSTMTFSFVFFVRLCKLYIFYFFIFYNACQHALSSFLFIFVDLLCNLNS